jgi:hypothetical protein
MVEKIFKTLYKQIRGKSLKIYYNDKQLFTKVIVIKIAYLFEKKKMLLQN